MCFEKLHCFKALVTIYMMYHLLPFLHEKHYYNELIRVAILHRIQLRDLQ